MTLFQILPPLALLLTLAFAAYILARSGPSPKGAWRFPAAVSAVFAGFTAYQIATDGIVMFWTNHSVNATGNQVWFDLLFSVCIGFVLLLPIARGRGMAIAPWAFFVATTASIGLLAMLARAMYLAEREAT